MGGGFSQNSPLNTEGGKKKKEKEDVNVSIKLLIGLVNCLSGGLFSSLFIYMFPLHSKLFHRLPRRFSHLDDNHVIMLIECQGGR